MKASSDDNLTPARRQYLDLKRRHPDALLLYRLGDFYEMFDGDAETASRDLNITLTSRDFGRSGRSPMAGVPHHALSSYLKRLLAKGHRVAIAEQLSEAGHGLVERQVTRVLSPGTIADPGLLSARENNYLVALHSGRSRTGLAYCDVSTGEFAFTDFAGDELPALAAELARLRPAECLLAESATAPVPPGCPVTAVSPRWFSGDTARDRLLRHCGLPSLDALGGSGGQQGIGAAAAIVEYVRHTNPELLRVLRGVRPYAPHGYALLDTHTRRNLELFRTSRSGERAGSLLSVLDHTATAMGGRLLRRWLNRPLTDVATLNERLDVVEALASDGGRRARLLSDLGAAGDLERLAGRAIQYTASPRDLLLLAQGLRAAERLAGAHRTPSTEGAEPHAESEASRAVNQEPGEQPSGLQFSGDPAQPSGQVDRSPAADMPGAAASFRERLGVASTGDIGRATQPSVPQSAHPPLSVSDGDLQEDVSHPSALRALLARISVDGATAELIERAVSAEEGRPIQPGFDAELDALQEDTTTARQTLLAMEQEERQRTGIRSLKISFNRIYGYYIEVSRANLKHVPERYLRRQTLTNAERFITPELKDWEARILRAEERIGVRAAAVYREVLEAVADRADDLLATAHAVAELDVLTTFAALAVERGYVRPRLDRSLVLDIRAGRHPVIERTLEAGAFVANDLLLEAVAAAPASEGGSGPPLVEQSIVEPPALWANRDAQDAQDAAVRATPLPGGAVRNDAAPVPLVVAGLPPGATGQPEAVPPIRFADEHQTAAADGPEPESAPGGAPPRLLLLTGPNMAGKSTYLRQSALIVLLAQCGSFVPAAAARIGVVDRIFTRVGAQDDLAAGASTFLVEMTETAAMLRQATNRSLLVFDEVGRGTSTFDGMAIAHAVIEDVHDRIGARTLFATHFHELTTLAGQLPGVANANVAVAEQGDEVVFLRRVQPGAADRSYGIHVARLAGLPEGVTSRAELLLHEYEQATAGRRHVTDAGDAPPASAPEAEASERDLLDPAGWEGAHEMRASASTGDTVLATLPAGVQRDPAAGRRVADPPARYQPWSELTPGPDGRFDAGRDPDGLLCPRCLSQRDADILRRLRTIQLAATTPLQAINALHGLQEAMDQPVACTCTPRPAEYRPRLSVLPAPGVERHSQREG